MFTKNTNPAGGDRGAREGNDVPKENSQGVAARQDRPAFRPYVAAARTARILPFPVCAVFIWRGELGWRLRAPTQNSIYAVRVNAIARLLATRQRLRIHEVPA